MNAPSEDPNPSRAYDLRRVEELQRLHRELEGYLRTSLKDGADHAGRRFAYDALRKLNGTEKKS